jgi:hypothetical protein
LSEHLEDEIVEVLRNHGAEAVDVTALRVGSLAQARRIRHWRVGLTSAATAVAVLGLGTAISASSGVDGSPLSGAASPYGSAAEPPKAGVTTSLPPSDQPGAAVRPDLVAKDPGTLHFDVDTAAVGAAGISYSNSSGVESAEVWGAAAGHFTAWYYLAQQRADLDRNKNLAWQSHDPVVNTQVFGRPATLVHYPGGFDGKHSVYQIMWQPTNGLWAQVEAEAGDTAAAMKAVFALKLNHSQRCVAPFRLRQLPTGYRWTGCDVSLGPSKPWETASIELTNAKGHEIAVNIGYYSTGEPFTANTTAGARLAQWIERSERPSGTSGTSITPASLFIPITGWVNVLIDAPSSAAANDSLTKAEAVQVAALVDVGSNFTDPTSWPERAVG